MAQLNKTVAPHSIHIHPTHLWVGNHASTMKEITTQLQHIFCSKHACGTCVQCRMITSHQHPNIRWFAPEKNYTREQIAPIFEQLSLQLNDGERFYFIIEHSDTMSAACANSLLKSLEEPPTGYYFFLQAERLQQLLPTIQSRCMIHYADSEKEELSQHPLFDFFANASFNDPLLFAKTLDTSEISEHETSSLLDAILSHWIQTYQKALISNEYKAHAYAQKAIATVSHAFSRLPMPGSSRLFWKNLYIEMKE